MLLVKRGVGRYEEMPKELKDSLIQAATDMTLKEYSSQKRPFQFKMSGSKGYKNGKFTTVFNRGKGIPFEYTIRHKGESLRLAYCDSVEEIRNQSGNIEQKLMSNRGVASSVNLGLMFMSETKRIIVDSDNYDKALFMTLYPECSDSPFRVQNRQGTYDWIKPEQSAKNQFLKQRELLEIQNKIMIEIDIFTLKSYATSLGASEVEHMGEEEIRMIVLNDAVRDIERFKVKLNSSTFNLSGDVLKIYHSGVLKVQRVDKQDIWTYGKGDLKGNIISALNAENGEDKLRGITRYLFENPSTFDTLKSIYFEETGVDKKELESGNKTLAQSDNFAKIEELIAENKIYLHKPTSKVFVKFPDGTKEAIIENVNSTTYKEEVCKYVDENPDILAQLSE